MDPLFINSIESIANSGVTLDPEFLGILHRHAIAYYFFKEYGIAELSCISPLWRKNNKIYKVNCKNDYKCILKEIPTGKSGEIQRFALLKKTYPLLFPELFAYDENCYVMEYVSGITLLDVKNETDQLKMALQLGKFLADIFLNRETNIVDLQQKVKRSFYKYRNRAASLFDPSELILDDFHSFSTVSTSPSHDDFTTGNVLFCDDQIKIIDPNDAGIDDVAKDIGRYLASMFFNIIFLAGHSKSHALDLAAAYLSQFEGSSLERIRYFLGESLLAFITFQSQSYLQTILKDLAISVLTSDDDIIDCLDIEF